MSHRPCKPRRKKLPLGQEREEHYGLLNDFADWCEDRKLPYAWAMRQALQRYTRKVDAGKISPAPPASPTARHAELVEILAGPTTPPAAPPAPPPPAPGSPPPPRETKYARSRRLTDEARQHILDHFTRPDVLAEAEAIAQVAATTLSEKFRTRFGERPRAMAIRLRLELAKRLLRETDTTIVEISSQAGYLSLSYFGERFHHATGMSPTEYRQKVRAEK